jgi:predicted GNAT family acetyltransferase
MDVFEILKEKYSDIKFELYPREKDMSVLLTGFIVPYKLRGTGIGTRFMEDLIKIADENRYKIKLSPSSSYGGNVNRLFDFYGRFGFVRNKGKNRDFTHREDMYRDPKDPNNVENLNEQLERIKSIIKSII